MFNVTTICGKTFCYWKDFQTKTWLGNKQFGWQFDECWLWWRFINRSWSNPSNMVFKHEKRVVTFFGNDIVRISFWLWLLHVVISYRMCFLGVLCFRYKIIKSWVHCVWAFQIIENPHNHLKPLSMLPTDTVILQNVCFVATQIGKQQIKHITMNTLNCVSRVCICPINRYERK